jgi:1,5-anhydro-D-fructose reductase (1,5-anhydro-D-mannitol-forming)
MAAAAAAAGRTLAVDHHLRAAESLERMRSLLAAGTIGEPRLIRTLHRCFVRPGRRAGWRMTDPARGAGVILDLTVHTADAIRFVSGREVQSVSGHAAPADLGRDGIEGAVAGTMRLSGDLLVSFSDAWSQLSSLSSIEAHGDDGELCVPGVLDGSRVELDGDPYQRTVERFVAAVRGDGQPAATADDGVRSLAIALALRAAVAERRAVDVRAADRPARRG